MRIQGQDFNTFIGFQVNQGIATGTAGSRNIYIGHKAGWDETGDDTLIIDNADRGSEALGRTDALIYGVMNATPSSQTLVLNAAVSSRFLMTLSGGLRVDQASATGAIPVLILDQVDVSEELIEFISTIGVGNAIEAVGAKTLTTTHFLKVTLPGGLTRYIPCGTIA